MNNHEAVVACLRNQREARNWTDESAATAVLQQLGLDPQGEAKDATPTPEDTGLTEDAVTAHEQAAYEAVQKAKQAREELNRQQQAEGADQTPASRPPSTDPADLAPGTMEPNLPPVPAPAHALEPPTPPTPPEPEPEPVLEGSKKARAKAADEAGNSDQEQDSKRK